MSDNHAESSRRRSEIDVVGETLALLHHLGFIDSMRVDVAASHLGLQRQEYQRSLRRRERARWTVPNWARLVEDQRKTKERPTAVDRPDSLNKPSRVRKQREVDGAVELWCSGGGHLEPHWAPEHAFAPRSDRPWSRIARCGECQPVAQRSRYLSVKAEAALGSIGVSVLVDDDSALLAVQCKGCGKSFEVGDRATGDAFAFHVGCHAAAVDTAQAS